MASLGPLFLLYAFLFLLSFGVLVIERFLSDLFGSLYHHRHDGRQAPLAQPSVKQTFDREHSVVNHQQLHPGAFMMR